MKKTKDQIKKRIFDIIQIGTQVDIVSKFFDYFIVVMIVLSITVTFLQTFQQMEPYHELLNHLELFTIIIFIVEYLLRMFTSDLLFPDKTKEKAMFAYVISFYGMVDLLTIISYFSDMYSNGFVALRMIRVVRILKMFRVNKNSDAFSVVAGVLKEKRSQIISSIFMIAMLIMGASLCMYGFEHEVQPEVFDNAFSGVWWAMSTILTIGYGDIYPITLGGRIVAIIIALLGVCAVAIPTGVISAGFVEYYTKIKHENGEIMLAEDINEMVARQARRAGLSVENYIETLIYEKEQTGKTGGEKGNSKRNRK